MKHSPRQLEQVTGVGVVSGGGGGGGKWLERQCWFSVLCSRYSASGWNASNKRFWNMPICNNKSTAFTGQCSTAEYMC